MENNNQPKKQRNNVILPYPIETYVTTVENGISHIDQIYKYVYDRNGLGVILVLEVLNDPRLSVRIDINHFLTNWSMYDISKEEPKKRAKLKG